MTYRIRLPQVLMRALRLEDIQCYLERHHWHLDSYKANGKAAYYLNKAVPEADLLLPLDRELGDYAECIAHVLLALAAVENRPGWEVLNDLSRPPADVLPTPQIFPARNDPP